MVSSSAATVGCGCPRSRYDFVSRLHALNVALLDLVVGMFLELGTVELAELVVNTS